MNKLKNGTIAVGAPGSEMRKQAEIQDELLGALKAVKSALDKGELIGDPSLIHEKDGMVKFVKLVNQIMLAIYKAEGGP